MPKNLLAERKCGEPDFAQDMIMEKAVAVHQHLEDFIRKEDNIFS
jgi:hypothetical protein